MSLTDKIIYKWLDENCPGGFWRNSESHSLYADWLSKKEGFKSLDDWYNATPELFSENSGSSLLFKYYDKSVYDFVKKIYPEFNWEEAKFTNKVKSYSVGIAGFQAPVVEAPVVEAPVVEAPVVEPPVVEAPIVKAPIVEVPIVEAPIVEAPVVVEPVVVEPVVEAPVVEVPIIQIMPAFNINLSGFNLNLGQQ
jgi:hypothetical protein